MINNNSTKLVWALISGMFFAIMALIGVSWSDVNGDIRNVQDDIKEIQRAYYQIPALVNQIEDLSSQLKELDSKVDTLRFRSE